MNSRVYGPSSWEEDREARWPPGSDDPESEVVRTECEACNLPWRIHKVMAGSRLKCRCGEWVSVPLLEAESPAAAVIAGPEAMDASGTETTEGSVIAKPAHQLAMPLEEGLARDDHGQVVLAQQLEAPSRNPVHDHDALRYANVQTRKRWMDRTLIELVLMMLAFLGPPLLITIGLSGETRDVMMPMGGLITSALVICIALGSRAYAFQGLRGAKLRYFAEALLACAVALGCAYLLVNALRSSTDGIDPAQYQSEALRKRVGLPMLLFMIAVVPGIFEEIAFRGLLQGRLSVLFGSSQGVWLTGMAFALAHGITLAFPIHLSIGIYLCWLRLRSGSMLPGIMLHMLYNGTLVVIGYA